MILDWAKQCELIHTTKELSRDDPADNKKRYTQEIVYVCYLRYVLGKNELQCYKEWKKIKNGVASIFKDDEDQLLIEFNSIYKKTGHNKYMSINCSTPLQDVEIYESEISFLNGLDVPIWVKQYWLCLLVYYKFMIQKYNRVQKTKTLNAWALRQTEYKRKNYGGNCQDIIAQYKKSVSKAPIIDYAKTAGEQYPTYKPSFLKTKGNIVYLCNNINNIQEIFSLLKSNTRVCDVCGAEFIVSTKTKRTICDNCYENYLKNRLLAYKEIKKAKKEQK